ncbi:MAG: hypothetical protein LBH59_00305 [Planctomycetaceae bacterium]|jgi:hypothetical protein|nr:hypothetical protein [Planctomycetaceae bacterium]
MNFEEYKTQLQNATTEEMVKACYAKYFNINYDTKNKHDLYTSNVLFEFKYNKNFQNLKNTATTLAQILYYVRRLKYHDITKKIPTYLCLANEKNAIITETNFWSSYYQSNAYDWDRAASLPDPKLVDHLVKEPETEKLHIYKIAQKGDHGIFKTKLEEALKPQQKFDFGDKKIINEENFEAVYDHWKNVIGQYIVNGYKESFYFLANIQQERIIVDKENNRVVFNFEDRNSKTQKIRIEDYDYFWSNYEYVSDTETINGIHAKLDRLTDDSQRRFEGEFYTPLPFAQKAIHYFAKILGKNWYKSGKFRIWDMAAGTGNLEYHLPADSYKFLYLSTLHAGEADHLKKVFPNATCFQYDYLNDDVDYLFSKEELPFEPEWKMPQKLREDLSNPELTWIVFINPPFATSQDARGGGRSKKGVSKTKVERLMQKRNIGHAKRELFVQFMFRIVHEMPKNTYLGMFAKLNYLNAPNSVNYRDEFFNYKYENGFLFHSKNFHGVTGNFPISFLIWNLSKKGKKKTIEIDITDNETKNIGIKHLQLIDKNNILNQWFPRPENSKDYILPPLSNGITVKSENVDTRHRARPDFLASLCSNGNDFQHAKYVTILSSPNASAGAFTIIKENFEKSMILHAVRKIPKPTWLNDRNQFLVPHIEPDKEFTNDCIVWGLFSNSNQTTSLKDISYLGKKYQIKNHFFPFRIMEIKKWKINDTDFRQQIDRDIDRFVADWLSHQKFSKEAKHVLECGEKVYQLYFENLNKIITKKMLVNTWDAGWYQVRFLLREHNLGMDELEALNATNKTLAEKILSQIESYGFLDKDEVYE